MGLFWLPLGWFLGLCLQFVLQSRKSHFLQTLQAKTWFLRPQGGHFRSLFRAKMALKSVSGLKWTQMATKFKKHQLPSALGGPRGPKNKFWKFLKRAEGERRVRGGAAKAPLEDPLAPRAASRARLLKEKKKLRDLTRLWADGPANFSQDRGAGSP